MFSFHSSLVTFRTFHMLTTPSSPPVAKYFLSQLNFIVQIAFLGLSVVETKTGGGAAPDRGGDPPTRSRPSLPF